MPDRSVPSRLAFLLGHPVAHSLSPSMQNAAFRRLRLPCRYAALDVAPRALPAAVELLRMRDVLGANVTVPHKAAVIPFLDRVEDDARWLSSVNTITKRGRKLCGASTDGLGFLRSLGSAARGLKGAVVLLIGAGGGARAVAGALLRAGVARMLVMDLDPARARHLIRLMREKRTRLDASCVSRGEAESALPSVTLVVQATPLGLHKGDGSPIVLSRARKGTLAVDLVYHRKTEFLKQAERRGLRARSGLGMLLHQGALSFGMWTGRRAPIRVMERALERARSGLG